MIIKAATCQLPSDLQERYANGITKHNPLRRLALRGLETSALGATLEVYACQPAAPKKGVPFKIEIQEEETLATEIRSLAKTHQLSFARVFCVLVHLGWKHINQRATELGADIVHSTGHQPSHRPSPGAKKGDTPVAEPNPITPARELRQSYAQNHDHGATVLEPPEDLHSVMDHIMDQFGLS